jgi:hypothetical protein
MTLQPLPGVDPDPITALGFKGAAAAARNEMH